MWDNDIQLIVKIFQKILSPRQMENSVEYLERHTDEIKVAGCGLKFLQLAKSDKTSPLGWRPTQLLTKAGIPLRFGVAQDQDSRRANRET
jgi:hypothetical protein